MGSDCLRIQGFFLGNSGNILKLIEVMVAKLNATELDTFNG